MPQAPRAVVRAEVLAAGLEQIDRRLQSGTPPTPTQALNARAVRRMSSTRRHDLAGAISSGRPQYSPSSQFEKWPAKARKRLAHQPAGSCVDSLVSIGAHSIFRYQAPNRVSCRPPHPPKKAKSTDVNTITPPA
jgi:hypothetical protein